MRNDPHGASYDLRRNGPAERTDEKTSSRGVQLNTVEKFVCCELEDVAPVVARSISDGYVPSKSGWTNDHRSTKLMGIEGRVPTVLLTHFT